MTDGEEVVNTPGAEGCKLRIRRCDDYGHHYRTREVVECVA